MVAATVMARAGRLPAQNPHTRRRFGELSTTAARGHFDPSRPTWLAGRSLSQCARGQRRLDGAARALSEATGSFVPSAASLTVPLPMSPASSAATRRRCIGSNAAMRSKRSHGANEPLSLARGRYRQSSLEGGRRVGRSHPGPVLKGAGETTYQCAREAAQASEQVREDLGRPTSQESEAQ